MWKEIAVKNYGDTFVSVCRVLQVHQVYKVYKAQEEQRYDQWTAP